jgi:predicted CXXCH cytochrome family protein
MIGYSKPGSGNATKAGPPQRRSLFLSAALMSGCLVLFAMEGNSQSSSGLTAKTHPPTADMKCADCHEQILSSKILHQPVKERKCSLCHKIPTDGGPASLTEESKQLCFKCHPKEKFKGSYLHGPYAVGACATCHEPHGSAVAGLLRTSGRQMCLTCHSDMNARFTNAKFQHKASAAGCTGCHFPHASDNAYSLRTAMPGLCANCHPAVFSGYEKAAVKHTPVTDPPACLNCHDPHMGGGDRLLVADEMDVCLKCHDRAIKKDKYELTNMKQLLAANPEHHGPIQGKECSGCHRPHGSAYSGLLTNEYSKEFYAPFRESNYELCFRCHDSMLVKQERTTKLTDFRDGDRNLHFVHVNKTPKGRTCRSCHETHASTLPNHIRVSVPFGTWSLPVGFMKFENGGTCESGCHVVQKYDRQVPQAKRP